MRYEHCIELFWFTCGKAVVDNCQQLIVNVAMFNNRQTCDLCKMKIIILLLYMSFMTASYNDKCMHAISDVYNMLCPIARKCTLNCQKAL